MKESSSSCDGDTECFGVAGEERLTMEQLAVDGVVRSGLLP